MLRRVETALAALLLCAVVGLVGLAAVSRAMGMPVIWSIEIAQLIFLWLCILAIDVALQEERHFGLQILSDNVTPRIARAVEAGNIVILTVLLAFLAWHAWGNTLLMYDRLDGYLQIRGSWLHASMLVGFLLMIRTLIAKLHATLTRSAAV